MQAHHALAKGTRIQTLLVGRQSNGGIGPGPLQLLNDHRRVTRPLKLGALRLTKGSSVAKLQGPT